MIGGYSRVGKGEEVWRRGVSAQPDADALTGGIIPGLARAAGLWERGVPATLQVTPQSDEHSPTSRDIELLGVFVQQPW